MSSSLRYLSSNPLSCFLRSETSEPPSFLVCSSVSLLLILSLVVIGVLLYNRSSNFAINYSKVPFIGSTGIDFGKEVKFNVPFKADLLGGAGSWKSNEFTRFSARRRAPKIG